MSQIASPIIDVAESQEADEILTMKFDTTLDHTTLIPVLRGGLPMFVAAQPLLASTSCILVRCYRKKGSNCVVVDWSGRRPFLQAPGDGRLVVLDTVIATGDTVAKLCDELWESSGRRERSVVVMCCYAAPAALVRLSRHRVVQYIVVARRAEGCDEAGYLVPTTNGDIGDKLFGEKEEYITDTVSPVVVNGQGAAMALRDAPALLERNEG
ncbi:hypothetical protein CMUS01_13929 [Colletotrichum musicola]|uniref:Phosphoribosyltransferase domain-containing protein n=1 Tax=Colletotrichum musicola TaxID=2175873 RepID=A0A8H6J860_9PEZI|nr:hypothetical protein CMUS01_13929 [Colletotrichum musicola]